MKTITTQHMDACTKATGTARLGIPSRVRFFSLSPERGGAGVRLLYVRAWPPARLVYTYVPHTRCTVTSIHPRNPPPRRDMRGGCGSAGREGYAGARLLDKRTARVLLYVRARPHFPSQTRTHSCVCVVCAWGVCVGMRVRVRERRVVCTLYILHGGEGMHTGSRVRARRKSALGSARRACVTPNAQESSTLNI